MAKIVTLGEIMLRLSPPGNERLFQSPSLATNFGGAEANVAVSLARFGHTSCFVSRLPRNAVGDAALRALRAESVDTHHILRGGDRLGIYFVETSTSQRPPVVIYDRARSAIAELDPAELDWPAILADADWLHVTGINPALGEGPGRATAEALAAARAAGLATSFDLNFRPQLWTPTAAQAAIRPLMRHVDVVIANVDNLQKCLGVEIPAAAVAAGATDAAAFHAVARDVARAYGLRQVGITLRESLSASEHGWSAVLYDTATGDFLRSQRYLVRLVDRIGCGDSFAAGLIHGLVTGEGLAAVLRFAVAASALKQTIPGDFNLVSAAEVTRLVATDDGRVQR